MDKKTMSEKVLALALEDAVFFIRNGHFKNDHMTVEKLEAAITVWKTYCS